MNIPTIQALTEQFMSREPDNENNVEWAGITHKMRETERLQQLVERGRYERE